MIVVIRIGGLVKVKREVAETLDRLRLRRKYSCVIIDEKNNEIMSMVKKVRDFIGYGEIDQVTLAKLIKARGKRTDKKEISETEAENIAKEIMTGKKLKDTELKPFFRLHPAKGGFKSTKLHYPKGVLGSHGKDIVKLLERML